MAIFIWYLIVHISEMLLWASTILRYTLLSPTTMCNGFSLLGLLPILIFLYCSNHPDSSNEDENLLVGKFPQQSNSCKNFQGFNIIVPTVESTSNLVIQFIYSVIILTPIYIYMLLIHSPIIVIELLFKIYLNHLNNMHVS